MDILHTLEVPNKELVVVMDILHTLEVPNKELVVTVLHPNLAWWRRPQGHNSADLKELEDFALYIFDALRNRPDWSSNC